MCKNRHPHYWARTFVHEVLHSVAAMGTGGTDKAKSGVQSGVQHVYLESCYQSLILPHGMLCQHIAAACSPLPVPAIVVV